MKKSITIFLFIISYVCKSQVIKHHEIVDRKMKVEHDWANNNKQTYGRKDLVIDTLSAKDTGTVHWMVMVRGVSGKDTAKGFIDANVYKGKNGHYEVRRVSYPLSRKNGATVQFSSWKVEERFGLAVVVIVGSKTETKRIKNKKGRIIRREYHNETVKWECSKSVN